MGISDEILIENPRQPIRVYRSVFNFFALLIGFLAFLTIGLLDLFGVTLIGWFAYSRWFGYGFLAFLIMGFSWLVTIFVALRRPVIEITQKEVRLTSVSRPYCCTTLDLSQIARVFAKWQPDTVPTYVVFEGNSSESVDSASGVWSHHEGSRVYFESSNLTMNAVEIANILQQQISNVNIGETQD